VESCLGGSIGITIVVVVVIVVVAAIIIHLS